MSTGKPYEGEERGYLIENRFAICLSTKIPLFDVEGKIVGLLGVSFDITDRERAGELEKQMELYEVEKMDDICAPIQALKVVEYVCKDKLAERENKMLEFSVKSIKDIGDRLISKYRRMKKSVYNNTSHTL
ncbi:MAG: PAS domain-containing protein [Endomicrobium sp.]|jgi:hypothetical protein|nr:PAS domain-containing protein [Endomicrobium sp.]